VPRRMAVFFFVKVVQIAQNVIEYTNKFKIKATAIAKDDIRRLEIV
jgi:hypothetical protein